MKKLLCLVLAIVMVVAVFAACGEKPEDVKDPSKSDKTIYELAGIKPLEEETDLTIMQLTGGGAHAINYIIDQFGGFEYANINVSFEVFQNGPVANEASKDWDVGTIGLGGVFTGVLQYDMKVIAMTNYDHFAQNFFARKDSDIVAAGNTVPAHPKLIGSKATWSGKQFMFPTGTPLHFTLAKALTALGMTEDDITVTHMDVVNANTAFRANTGDVAGLWGQFGYADDMAEYADKDKEGKRFVKVADAADLGVVVYNTMVTPPHAYNDAKKNAAIQKLVELYFVTTEWVFANDDNFREGCRLFAQWDEEQGVKSTADTIYVFWGKDHNLTLQETYDAMTKKDAKGLTTAEGSHYYPMEFFIGLGKYTQEQANRLVQAGTFDPSYVTEAMNRRNAK